MLLAQYLESLNDQLDYSTFDATVGLMIKERCQEIEKRRAYIGLAKLDGRDTEGARFDIARLQTENEMLKSLRIPAGAVGG